MTKEDKELLLKDLCARLCYRPTVLLSGKEHCILCGIDGDNVYLNIDSDPFNVESIKPYLRPMSSMTDAEKKELWELLKTLGMISDVKRLDWLVAHHFDIRNLIEKGLALEAPEGMYK